MEKQQQFIERNSNFFFSKKTNDRKAYEKKNTDLLQQFRLSALSMRMNINLHVLWVYKSCVCTVHDAHRMNNDDGEERRRQHEIC